MRQNLTLSAALVLAVVPGRTACAQEKGHVGLTMGYPASVGVVWQVTDSIAVRPELSFTSTSDGTPPVSSSSTTVGTGVSALFYLAKWDAVRAYVSPRYIYQRASGTSEVAVTPLLAVPLPGAIALPPVSTTITTTLTTHTAVGAFGAQYTPHRRFGVFGEVGLGYSALKSSSSILAGVSVPSSTSHTWSTRTGAGVIFYF